MDTRTSNEPSQQDCDAFHAWLSNQNIAPQGFCVRQSDFGVGLYSSQDKAEGLLKIPEKSLITAASAKNDSRVGPLLQQLGQIVPEDTKEHEELTLMLYILYEYTQPDSIYAPYFKLFPKSYPASPIFFTEEEIEYLAGTSLYFFVPSMIEGLRELHERVKAWLESLNSLLFGELTWDEFSWSFITVVSRTFKVMKDGQEVAVMSPFIDSANHDPNGVFCSKIFDSQTRELVIRSEKSIKANEQVFLQYGPLANLELLFYYGFALPNNRYDVVPISLENQGVDDEDFTTSVKKVLLMQCSSEWYTLDHDLKLKHNDDGTVQGPDFKPNFFPSVRLQYASQEDLEGVTVQTVQEAVSKPISEQNEQEINQAISAVVSAMLEMYGADPEEPIPEHLVPAMIYKKGQKDILNAVLQSVTTGQ